MLDRWRDLDLGQRRVLATLAAMVLAVAVASGLVALTHSDGTAQALDTGASSSTSATSSTSSSTPVSVTAPGPTSSTVEVDATSTSQASVGTTVTTKAPGTTRATTATTQPASSTTTTTATTGGGACNTGGGSAAANRIATLFCAYRADHDLARMTRNSQLDQLAQQWAQHMADEAEAGMDRSTVLAHNPDYPDGVVAGCSGCTGWAENVAYNTSADNAWNVWLGSSTHLAAIQDAHAGEYGVGAATGGGYTWFVQDFGRYPG